jgi:hypothetical protein
MLSDGFLDLRRCRPLAIANESCSKRKGARAYSPLGRKVRGASHPAGLTDRLGSISERAMLVLPVNKKPLIISPLHTTRGLPQPRWGSVCGQVVGEAFFVTRSMMRRLASTHYACAGYRAGSKNESVLH